jgi:uncharacterized cupredoxin-like copper-binding protein
MDDTGPDGWTRGRRARLGALVAMAIVIAACGSSSATTSPPAGGGTANTVNVALQEFAVTPDVTSVPAGKVTFVANNSGPEDVHELVVIKTDLAPDALPVDGDGKVTEDTPDLTVIGEAEDIEVGASRQFDLDLEPGKYVLICNILQTEADGSLEAHYQVGMRTAFEVE